MECAYYQVVNSNSNTSGHSEIGTAILSEVRNEIIIEGTTTYSRKQKMQLSINSANNDNTNNNIKSQE